MKVPARGPLERGSLPFCFLPFFRLGDGEGEEAGAFSSSSKVGNAVVGVAL